ncbi:hypothetical protein FRC11_013868 [Ceratobasidium sp. 423]|nr:hypothetical protein FRC11_013868 [Ceratobasidium sp. 423]
MSQTATCEIELDALPRLEHGTAKGLHAQTPDVLTDNSDGEYFAGGITNNSVNAMGSGHTLVDPARANKTVELRIGNIIIEEKVLYLAGACMGIFAAGLNFTATGANLPSFQDHYHLPYETVSLVFLAGFGGYLVSCLLNTVLQSVIGTCNVLLMAGALYGGGALLISFAPPFPVLIVGLCLMGFGGGFYEACLTSVVSHFEDSRFMNIAFAFSGLGALVSPFIIGALAKAHVSWKNYVTPSDHEEAPEHKNVGARLKLAMRMPVTWIGAVLIVCSYAIVDVLSNWLTSYLIDVKGSAPDISRYQLSIFWAGLSAGRIFFSLPFIHIRERAGNNLLLALMGGAIGLLWALNTTASNWASVAVAGFFLGPNTPGIISIISTRVPPSLKDIIISTIIGSALVGGTLGSLIFGMTVGKVSPGLRILPPVILVNELKDASKLLSLAMDRYVQAYAAILSHYDTGSTAQALLDCALTELPKVSSYEEKFQLAKAALRRTRNQCPSRVPVSILPFEILSHIFWLSWDCLFSADRRLNLVYPSVLLRVCSRWRQITLASHKLWSHIDVYTNWAPNLSLKRAKLFETQSNRLSLDLHIKTGLLSFKHHKILGDFYQSVAPRIQSFEIHHGDDLHPLYGNQQPWLDTLLSGVVAGTLTRLCIKSYCLQAVPAFLIARDSTLVGRSYIRISVAERQLEHPLSSIIKLQLKGIYPFWTSRAYYELVELSLEAFRGANIGIKESELVVILQASPRLQVLQFGLGVELTQKDGFPPPVQLDDLRSLQLISYSHSARESVLRIVHLGQTPLQLTIKVADEVRFVLPSRTWAELVSFATRSNIALLHIEQRERGFFDPSKVLPLMPQLEALVLDGFSLGQQCEELLEGYDAKSYLFMLLEYSHPPLPQQLRQLRLIRCKIYWSDFRHEFEIHPTEKLALDRCEVDLHPPLRSDLESASRRITPVVELCETRVTRVASGSGC